MEKTRFAGLTELDADESVLDDGAAFIGRDREVIDRLLQIGAKTHRHTGRSGISNPTAAPSASVVASGGTIGPDLDIEIGYTLEDDSGGETLISPVASVSTPGALQAPTSAIAAAPDYTAGSLPLGDYYYGITYVDAAGGETPTGPVALVEREPGFLNAKVLVSGLAGGLAGASATAWKLYRAVNGGDFGYLASGVANSYLDDGSVGTVGDITPPLDDGNATNSVNSLIVNLPTAGGIQNATFVRLYLTETADFSGNTYLDRFPVASAGHTVVYTSLDFQDGQPPDVNLSIGGAQQIDPDTELLDWHWKRAVATVPALGSGVLGDVRMVTADGSLWGVLHASAATSQAWTELGASAAITVTDADGPLEQGVVKLVFGGSGEVSVGVTDLGGGSAKVSIFAPSAQAPPFAESDITGLVSDLAGKQPLDSDLTAISALATTPYGRALLTLADAAAGRSALGAATPLTASADVRLAPVTEIDFAASGEAGVSIKNLGGGSAQVIVFAPPTPSIPAAVYASAQGPKLGPVSEIDFAASGNASVKTTDLGGGSAEVTLSSPYSFADGWSASGAIHETFPVLFATTNTNPPASGGILLSGGITVLAGETISSISVLISNAGGVSGQSHQWFFLAKRDGTVIGTTEDHLAVPWARNTVKTLRLGTPWTPSVDTQVYVGVVVGATSTPQLVTTPNNGSRPVAGICWGGSGQTGFTDPASLPSSILIPVAQQQPFYAYLS